MISEENKTTEEMNIPDAEPTEPAAQPGGTEVEMATEAEAKAVTGGDGSRSTKGGHAGWVFKRRVDTDSHWRRKPDGISPHGTEERRGCAESERSKAEKDTLGVPAHSFPCCSDRCYVPAEG